MPIDESDKPERGRLPDEVFWLIGTLGLVLPFVAVALGALGFWRLLSDDWSGWLLLVVSGGLFALDVGIDVWMANPNNSMSDVPDLNRPGAQYIGRVAALTSAIDAGRGKVRLGDTVWVVEGPDMAVGERVRVVGVDGVVLRVEAASSDAGDNA
ncbi:MAG: NfeD family protein [Alphaproteobacteria bacterium]|nr:NfeD family protein [Alphaproteobacteria bacterium]